MAITKEKKKEVLEELKRIIKENQSVVFVNFQGLKVLESTDMRKELRDKGVGYYVAKKTLTKRALDEASPEGEMPTFEGELALAYGEDLLDPAREIYSFQKKLEKRVSILGGIFEGKFLNQEEMLSVAQIPSIQTLQAQFVNLINSPIQGFVMALSQVAEKKESAS